jgi:hypothetical protein
MARGAPEYCMFCNSAPCACNKKVPTKKAKPPAPVKASVPPPPVVVAPAKKMPAPAAPPAKLLPRVVESKLSSSRPVRDPDEVALENAVTLFAAAGMLSEGSITEHRGLIKLPPTMIEALKWRARNGVG